MTSASSLAFPGSRTLATWWRQLAPFGPKNLWVGYLFVHRLEAPALWSVSLPLDPLLEIVLQALDLETMPPADTRIGEDEVCRRLDRRLHLGVPVVRRLLRDLAQLLLVEAPAGASWGLTPKGRLALKDRKIVVPQEKRSVFTFVEKVDAEGRRQAPPHFLNLRETPGVPWQVEADAPFDVSWLTSCLDQPPEWKAVFGFPSEVLAFPQTTPPPAGLPPPWDRVIVDHSERLLVALVLRSAEPALLGFAIRPEGWLLQTAEPLLCLPAAARAFSPDLADAADLLWKQAWRDWCRPRMLAEAEVDACRLTFLGDRLRIEAPASLVRRLQAGKSDIVKGEAWLLAGANHLRPAARLELVGGE